MEQSKSLFTFQSDGFTVQGEYQKKSIKWNDIECIIAFNEDKITYELIILDLFCKDGFSLRLSSETDGWKEFSSALTNQFQAIPTEWEKVMQLRPFITNLTLLYDSENRDLKTLCNRFYKGKS